jgi:glycosyltransferase involved in cell wall biosynthesis
MGYKQNLENLVECARLAARIHPELLFVLAGDGNRRAALQALAGTYLLDNLRLLPSMTGSDYANALAAADALLLNQGAAVRDMAFPSKLTAYVESGVPIVAAVAPESEVASELSQADAALLVEPEQPQQLLDALLLLRDDAARREELAKAARTYGGRYFQRDAALQGWSRFAAGLTDSPDAVSLMTSEAA